MAISITEYHTESTLQQSPADESQFGEHLFLADSIRDLEDSAKATSKLITVLEQDPRPEFADAIRANRDHLHQVTVVRERRHDRIERLEDDPMMMDEFKDDALALIVALPISQYLASIRPGILLWRDGDVYFGPCPYLGHDFDEDSFRIFSDDFAWCERCGGGNLFRVIGMVEALPSPYERVRRAAEIAGLELPEAPRVQSQHRSRKGMGGKERTGRGNVFQPIRIVNGRVAS